MECRSPAVTEQSSFRVEQEVCDVESATNVVSGKGNGVSADTGNGGVDDHEISEDCFRALHSGMHSNLKGGGNSELHNSWTGSGTYPGKENDAFQRVSDGSLDDGMQEKRETSSQSEALDHIQNTDRDTPVSFSADGTGSLQESCSVSAENHSSELTISAAESHSSQLTISATQSHSSLITIPDSENSAVSIALPSARSWLPPLSPRHFPRSRADSTEGESGKGDRRKIKVSFKYTDGSRDLEKGIGGFANVRDENDEKPSSRFSVADDSEQVCRVCHLNSEGTAGSSELIHIGCRCKDDLGLAHRSCGETWFKIRGNRICEICGETAKNIVGIGDSEFMEEWNDRDASSIDDERPRCWQSRPLCNFLLACMIVAFILPWLFRVSMF